MSLFVSIMAYLFVALVAIISTSKKFEKWKYRKSIKVILWVGLLVFGLWDVYNRFFDTKGDFNDVNATTKSTGNETNKKVEKVGLQVSGVGKKDSEGFNTTYKKLDTGFGKLQKNKIIYSAIIGFASTSDGKNPLVRKGNSEDSLLVDFFMTNYGKGTAFDLKLSGVCVIKNGGKLSMQKKQPPVAGNKALAWSPFQNSYYRVHADLNVNKNDDSIFYAIKIDFSDSTGVRKSYPQIFFLHKKSLELQTISDEDYNNIEAFLKENKFWKPPFRQ